MTAVDIFKQSLNFYGRLFNKVFWLSVASSLMPLLMIGGGQAGAAEVNPLGLVITLVVAMFFSVYMMCLIHQFSTEQDDSLRSAFFLTLKKFLPVTLTGMVFGLAVGLVALPASMVAAVLGSGIANESLRASLMALIVAIPLCWFMYRCFFAPYHTLAFGKNPIEALKASNSQVKGNQLVFRGFTLLSFVMLAYVMILVFINLMLAVSPVVKGFAEFVIGVLAMPFFSIFIYRLFEVSLPKPQTPPSIDEEV